MKNLSPAMVAWYASGATTAARCWRADLTDGRVIAATTCDIDLPIDGVIYQSVTGFLDSDVESSSELNPDNLEVDGFLVSPAITDDDIHSGAWDYAAIEMFEVNYLDLTMGKNIKRVGTLGEVKGGRIKFTAELRGLLQAYTRTIVRLVTKECTADLGDARCKVDLAAITVSGFVSSVLENRIILDQGAFQVDDWYTGGKLTWTSGANVGRSMEVKRNTLGRIELTHAMYEQIELGDTFTIYPGCLKRFNEDCIGKFGNGLNFRGFPDLPGERIYRQGGVHYDGAVSGGNSGGSGSGGGTGGGTGGGGTGGGTGGGGTGGGTGGTGGGSSGGDPYMQLPQEGLPNSSGYGAVNSINSVQIAWGDVWYRTPAGTYTTDSTQGTVSHITERHIFGLSLHPGEAMPWKVGDYVKIRDLPNPNVGTAPPSKTWTSGGVETTVEVRELNWEFVADVNVSSYVYFHRIARVTPATFELWNIRPVSSDAELTRLLAMPADLTVPYTSSGYAQRDTYGNYTSHTDARPRSFSGTLAPSGPSPWPGSPVEYGISPDKMNTSSWTVRAYDVLLGDVWYKTPSGEFTTDPGLGTVSHLTLRKRIKTWGSLWRVGDITSIIQIPYGRMEIAPYKEWTAPDGTLMRFTYSETNDWGYGTPTYPQKKFEHVIRVVDDDWFEIWSALPLASDAELQRWLAMPTGWTANYVNVSAASAAFGINPEVVTYDNPYPLSHNGMLVPAGPTSMTSHGW